MTTKVEYRIEEGNRRRLVVLGRDVPFFDPPADGGGEEFLVDELVEETV